MVDVGVGVESTVFRQLLGVLGQIPQGEESHLHVLCLCFVSMPSRFTALETTKVWGRSHCFFACAHVFTCPQPQQQSHMARITGSSVGQLCGHLTRVSLFNLLLCLVSVFSYAKW